MALAGCSEQPAGEPLVRARLDGSQPETKATPTPTPSVAADSACRTVTFEDVPLTHCTADPAKHRIAMANLGADKQPFASLSAFAASVDPAAIAFAINCGMYGDDLKPLGYYVQNGERLKELDRGTGEGNFYMKPNGVFFGTGGAWRVLGSNTFFETVGDRPEFGTSRARCCWSTASSTPKSRTMAPPRRSATVSPSTQAARRISSSAMRRSASASWRAISAMW